MRLFALIFLILMFSPSFAYATGEGIGQLILFTLSIAVLGVIGAGLLYCEWAPGEHRNFKACAVLGWIVGQLTCVGAGSSLFGREFLGSRPIEYGFTR